MPTAPSILKQASSRGLPGEQQDFALRALLLYLNRKFNAGQSRHHYVRDEQVRTFVCRGFQSL